MRSPEELANRVLEECESTNDCARLLGESGYPHGTWVSAERQIAGRGRLGRSWASQPGNLFLSYLARIEDRALWTWIPLATAVAVCRLLRKRVAELEPRIKWPNDLWLPMRDGNPAKLGGILCEAVGAREQSFVVIGLGLNCLSSPEGLDQPCVSLSDALSPRQLKADDLRQAVVRELDRTFAELERAGCEKIRADFESWSALQPGTEIEWTDSSGVKRRGRVLGLGAAGQLRVRLERDEETALFAEEVRATRLV